MPCPAGLRAVAEPAVATVRGLGRDIECFSDLDPGRVVVQGASDLSLTFVLGDRQMSHTTRNHLTVANLTQPAQGGAKNGSATRGQIKSAFSRLDIRGIVDRACPVRDIAIVTHGQVIEALIANRLTSPQPLLHVEDWARQWAVPEVFGIEPGVLNDDRIGRALDAIAPMLDHIVGSIGLTAIDGFGIDVSRIHWDMTSMSLFGGYDRVDDEFAIPSYGHPKDRRVDLKQIQTGLGVTGDGGIPIFHRAFDGRAGEVNQVIGAMESLRSMCTPRRFLLVGDSKLISFGNVAAMTAETVTFIAPASKIYVNADGLRAANTMTLIDVDYVADRDRTKPAETRSRYRVGEDT